jgi:DNA-binding response OmpR family regulator
MSLWTLILPEDAENARPPSAGKVLLVEDDKLAADLIEDQLVELGHSDIVRVETVEAALTLLRRFQPALAVLDANLRGVPAHAVATRLRAAGVPFIVSTGYDPSTLPTPFHYGIPLKKPYGRQALAAALTAALRARRDN